jgi:predicted HAD superfamily phosphohydrolase
VQERYNKGMENVGELGNELAHMNEELENIKQSVIERGDNIGDTKPLKEIKDAMVKLKVP